MSTRFASLACVLLLTLPVGAQSFTPQDPWTPAASFRSTFFVTPTGDPNVVAPMIRHFMGAGQGGTVLGDGNFAKVGIFANLLYTRLTEGAAKDYKFFINRGPAHFATFPLPPDVTSPDQLPEVVRFGLDEDPLTVEDNLAPWATIDSMPWIIAALEWARFTNLPLTVQLNGSLTHGGNTGVWEPYDLDRYIENLGKDQLMWDVSDLAAPNDPCGVPPISGCAPEYQDAGVDWGGFSFQTPTFADPDLAEPLGIYLPYQSYLERNAKMGIEQLLKIASHPRYAGKLAAIAFDAEWHYPAHENGSVLPTHPAHGDGRAARPFVEDYNPVMIRQFQLWLQQRYGDTTPMADSNGDGVTFGGDFCGPSGSYGSTGWVDAEEGINHLHSDPAAWTDIDPPRRYVDAVTGAGRTRYWDTWCNFRVEALEQFLERCASWIHSAQGFGGFGVPPERVFTHQTPGTGSFNEDRRLHGGQFHYEWMDDYVHVSTSHGRGGIVHYQPFNVVSGYAYFPNIAKREDAWGMPEFNPYILGPEGPFADRSVVQDVLQATWSHGAQVLWPLHWGQKSFPVINFFQDELGVHGWHEDDLGNFEGWGPMVGYQTWNSPPHSVLRQNSPTPGYLESPELKLDTARYPFVAVQLSLDHVPGSAGEVVLSYERDGVWAEVAAVPAPDSDFLFAFSHVFDMRSDPGWDGTITTRLRLQPGTSSMGDFVNLISLSLPEDNDLTSEFRELLTDQNNLPRPAPPPPWSPSLPIRFANEIAMRHGTEQLTIYGTNPVSATNNPPPELPVDHTDFGFVGNFESLSAVAGGITKSAILARPPTYLGLRKTGRFRRLILPNHADPLVPDLTFVTQVAIRDGFTSADGVRFRVVLRDQELGLHTLIDKEWRWNHWSPTLSASLAAFAGQEVEISFETQAVADFTGDEAVWGDPRIVRQMAFPSVAFDDGWVLESGEFTNVGGTINWFDTVGIRVGDDDQRRQFRSILSFQSAALPDNAVLDAAVIELRGGSQIGNPVATLGVLKADIVAGRFGNPGLEASDFSASPAGMISSKILFSTPTIANHWSFGTIQSNAFGGVSKLGTLPTEVRLAFAVDDDNDALDDRLGFHAGDASDPTNRPVLIVTYH